MSVSSANSPSVHEDSSRARPLAWFALVVSVVALGGSLFLSLGLNLKACPLCFYQRTFAMSLVAILTSGLVLGAGSSRLTLLALPVAAAGLGVAMFHAFAEARGTLECPAGIFGLGTAPQQSSAMFLVLFAILAADVRSSGVSWPAFGGALGIGALLTLASCTSNPPMPEPPLQPYPGPPEICRPPFPSQS